MTVDIGAGDIVTLFGECAVQDAETLTEALTAAPDARIDLSQCTQLHSAVVQALLFHNARLEGDPQDLFLRNMVLPALIEAGASRDGASSMSLAE